MSNQEQEHYDAGAQTPVTDSGSILEKPKEEDMFQMPQMPERTWKDHAMITIFCLFIAFGGFVFGFDTGTISGFVNMSDFLRRFGQHNSSGYYFSNVRVGLVVSIFNIGCAFGSIFLTKLADIYGRRFGLMFSMAVYVIGIIIQIASINKWYQLFIGRIISGLGVGIISVLCPLFIGETAPKQLRGTLVYCFQLFITLGIFLGYCTTYGTKVYTDSRQWRIPLGLCFAWAIIMVVGMLSMPESPRFLVEKGKIEEAKKSVGRSNNLPAEDPGVYSEVMTIQAGIIHENSEGKATWAELVTGKPKIFQRVLMGMILQSLQQLTGDNYFFYYGTTIFKAVGLQDSFETSIVLGVVNFASTFVGIWAIEQFGRRKSLMVGAIAIFLCFIVYSILGSVALFIGPGYDPNNTHVPTGDGMIFVTCVCIFFFASTWAGGAYTIIAESYPIRIRSKAMAVASASNWVWGFLISFFTPFITSAIHFYYGFVFAGCMVFGTVYVYFCVMETKGLTLEEVDQLYASGLPPWKSSHWVPPRKEDTIAAAATAGEAKPEEERV